MTRVRPVAPGDAEAWLRMRVALWPDGSEAEHAAEIERFLRGDAPGPAAVLVAAPDPEERSGASEPVGLAELSIRSCAEGCRTARVAYLEGWYVAPAARRSGVGRALVEAAEAWARAQGCTEFASDTERDNRTSAAAHLALGFEDAGLVRCFRKDL